MDAVSQTIFRKAAAIEKVGRGMGQNYIHYTQTTTQQTLKGYAQIE